MTNKITIFGGNGFIGRHLVEELSRDKNNIIVVFDRFTDYVKSGENPYMGTENIQAYIGDYFNHDDIRTAIQGSHYVFHLISTTNPALSANDPLIDIETNILKSISLFQVCVEEGVKRVIFLSSGGTVYGDIDNPLINEDIVPKPVSPYGIGKLTIENYLRYFKAKHGLDSITYRVANPYGPGQSVHGKQGVIPIFMNHFIHSEPLNVFGDGSMKRDYIYITDLVRMISASYNKHHTHDIYNVGSGSGFAVLDIIRSIERTAGYKVPIQRIEKPTTYVQDCVLDISKFVNEFNIRPSISLNEGIERTWQYVKEIEAQ